MHPTSGILAAFTFLVSFCTAFDPADRDCQGRLCLTSFQWCDGNDCSYPPNVYPYTVTDYQGPPAIIQWTPPTPYNITWKNWDSRYPVTIRWSFPNSTDQESVIPNQWEINITAPSPGYYEWTPSPSDFPNLTDTNAAEAEGLVASPLNSIEIAQPLRALNSPDYDNSSSIWANTARLGYTAYSSQFVVLNGWAIQFALNSQQRVRNGYNHRIKLGVGIGVGLGVPVLIVLTAGLTWCAARKIKPKRAATKDSY